MAETLANGTVVPQGSDLINSNGVQAMRNLGSSVDGQLGNRSLVGHTHSWSQITSKPTNYSPSTHTHPISQVTGLQAALDGKVGTADPRLSDARTPTAHTHPVTDVTGLAARLAALEYDSGERDITSRVSDVVSGRVLVWRLGRTVFLTFDALVVTVPETPHWHTMAGLLPAGFRPPGINRFFQFAQQIANRAAGPARVSSNGTVVIYNAKSGAGNSLTMEGTISFPAEAALPTSLPGIPA